MSFSVIQGQVQLMDSNTGLALDVPIGTTIPAGTRSLIMAGSDGTNARYIRVASDGTLRIDPTGTTTQPVSGTVSAIQSGSWSLTNISGTISLPTGASTSALQTTGNSSLSSIDTKVPALGQAVMASSVPVTIASNQSTVSVNVAQVGGTATSKNSGVTDAGTQRVVLPTDQTAIPVTTTGGEEATYTVIAQATIPGNNKSMLAIYNPTGSAYVLKLREMYIRNPQTTATTGVAGKFELHRFASASAPTGGTALTVVAHDSGDAIPVSMRASTGDTISGEVATPLDVMWISTDEWGPGTADVESNQQAIANYLPARAKRDALIKPFYARPGEGIHMKFATNSTAGSIDVVFVFTKV